MRPLAASDILRVWELGESAHPVDRALLLLSTAEPSRASATWLDLPLGERDACLLTLREQTVGPSLAVLASCPGCAEKYELSLETQALLGRKHAGAAGEHELTTGEFNLRFRVPSSRDLLAIRGLADVGEAKRVLAVRCIRSAQCGDASVEPETLPDEVIARLGEEMAERDPLADVPLALECADCGQSWQPRFDIAEFFWTEIRALARRVLAEVAELARLYGWSERDILAMSARRRHAYLELGGT